MRLPDVLETEVLIDCKVRGCGATFAVPIVYRVERVEHLTRDPAEPPDRVAFVGTRVEVDVEATLDLEALVRVHLDQHAATTETAVAEAPPVVEPPAWAEVEWCDAGGSCEHDECLARLAEDDDEPEGWRGP